MTEPTHIYYYENGSIQYKNWKRGNHFHRSRGPAFISYDQNGKIKNKTWFRDGKLHRKDKPARIEFYPTGRIRSTEWWIDNQRHRVVYPACVIYYQSLDILEFRYFNRGEEITDEVIRYLEENGLSDPLYISPEHQIILKMKFW